MLQSENMGERQCYHNEVEVEILVKYATRVVGKGLKDRKEGFSSLERKEEKCREMPW
jgi:hypothetical protein